MPVLTKVKLVCDVCGDATERELEIAFNRDDLGGVIDTWGRAYEDNKSIVCSVKCNQEHKKHRPPH